MLLRNHNLIIWYLTGVANTCRTLIIIITLVLLRHWTVIWFYIWILIIEKFYNLIISHGLQFCTRSLRTLYVFTRKEKNALDFAGIKNTRIWNARQILPHVYLHPFQMTDLPVCKNLSQSMRQMTQFISSVLTFEIPSFACVSKYRSWNFGGQSLAWW